MAILLALTEAKIHLDIPDDPSQDDLLNQLIDQIDELVAGELVTGGRFRVPGSHPISSVSATEYYNGPGRKQLLLRRRPVTAVTRVAVDSTGYYGKGTDAFPVSSDWTEGSDFVSVDLDATEGNPGILVALGSRVSGAPRIWTQGLGNVLVTYTAGYVTIPDDLKLAANQLLTATWNATDTGLGGPVDSVRVGDTAFQLLKDGPGPTMLHVRRILSRYQEVA